MINIIWSFQRVWVGIWSALSFLSFTTFFGNLQFFKTRNTVSVLLQATLFTENLRFLSSVASFTFWALLLASTTTSRAAHTGCFGCTPYSVGTINMSTKM